MDIWMLRLSAYDFTICTLTFLTCTYFLSTFFTWKQMNCLWKLLVFPVAPFIAMLVNQLHSMHLNLSVTLALLLAIAFLLFEGDPIQRFALSFMSIAISAAIENAALPLVGILLDEIQIVVTTQDNKIFIFSLINNLLLFVVLHSVSTFIARKEYFRSGVHIILLALLPVTNAVAGGMMVYLEQWVPPEFRTRLNFYVAGSAFLLLLSGILTFYVYGNSMERYSLKAKFNLLERMANTQLSFYKKTEGYLEEIKAERHDFAKHNQTILRLLHSNASKDEAISYINTLLEKRPVRTGGLVGPDLKNPALSAILTDVSEQCEEYGIAFFKDIRCSDLSFLDPVTTCSIFANALENAMEACRNIAESSELKKSISMKIFTHNHMLTICVENTKENPIQKKGIHYISSKINKELHGYGVLSIQNSVEKIGGVVSISHDETTFTLQIRINMNIS